MTERELNTETDSEEDVFIGDDSDKLPPHQGSSSHSEDSEDDEEEEPESGSWQTEATES
jgi:hypothetical protein